MRVYKTGLTVASVLVCAISYCLPPATSFGQFEEAVDPPFQEMVSPLQAVELADRSDRVSKKDKSRNENRDPIAQQFLSTDSTGTRRTFGHLAESPGLYLGKGIETLLQFESVQKDLEFQTYQFKDLADIQRKSMNQRRKLKANSWQAMETAPEEAEQLSSRLKDQAARTRQQFEDVLLPEQLERLRQIELELRICSKGIIAVLGETEIRNELGIDEVQLEDLNAKAAECANELEESLRKLKAEIRLELIGELTSEQQHQLREKLGEQFNWSQSDATEH